MALRNDYWFALGSTAKRCLEGVQYNAMSRTPFVENMEIFRRRQANSKAFTCAIDAPFRASGKGAVVGRSRVWHD